MDKKLAAEGFFSLFMTAYLCATLYSGHLYEKFPRHGVFKGTAYGMACGLAFITIMASSLMALQLSSRLGRAHLGVAVIALAGAAGIACLLPPVRRFFAKAFKGLRAESPLHAVGLSMYVVITMVTLGSEISVDTLKEAASAAEKGTQAPLLFALATNQLPMLVLAVALTGIGVTRTPRQALARLGFRRPPLRWLLPIPLFVIGLIILSAATGIATSKLTPTQSGQLTKAEKALSQKIPGIPGVVLVSASAGIGEEAIFRGAMIPVTGPVPSALTFTIAHANYGGASLANLYVLLTGLFLGFLWKKGGLVVAILTHAAYDGTVLAIAVLLANSGK